MPQRLPNPRPTETFNHRKVSFLLGSNCIFALKIPPHKTKLQTIKTILRESRTSRPYSSIQIRNLHGNISEIYFPITFLKLLGNYKKI